MREDDMIRGALLKANPPIDGAADWPRVVRRIRRNRFRTATLSLAGVAAVAVAVTTWVTRDDGTLVVSAPNGGCPFVRYVPFKLTYLPGDAPLPVQPLLFGYHPAFWAFPGGEIEMWRGTDIPLPSEPTQPITVLGHKGRIGTISDGYSVVFNLGDPNDLCTQWALVSHPGTTLEQTRSIAEGLVPA